VSNRSRPSNWIWPSTIRPGGIAISFRTDIAVTVLPRRIADDAERSPLLILMSTPSTALKMPVVGIK
jgi:hypothetical protein